MSVNKEAVPVEIEDDYQLALEEADVDDESANDASSSSNFVITSYGADYTVDTIISRVAVGVIHHVLSSSRAWNGGLRVR